MHCSFSLSILASLLSRFKGFLHPLGGQPYRFYHLWILLLLWLQTDVFYLFIYFPARLCEDGIDSFSFLMHFTGRVPPPSALHLQVISRSDKLRQGRGCGSLNQRSLHASSADSPFFLQRRWKQPRLPTCQEEMSHRPPPGLSSPGASLWPRSKAIGLNFPSQYSSESSLAFVWVFFFLL